MRITLQVTDGPHQGKNFTFQGHETFLVGRSRRAHLRLPAKDMFFSRVHFLVEVNPPQCRLMDMGSRNGTHVNGERVDLVDLSDGDVIKAGHTTFRLTIATAEDVPAPAPAPGPAPALAPVSVPVSEPPSLSPPTTQELAETLLTQKIRVPVPKPATVNPSVSVKTPNCPPVVQPARVTPLPGTVAPVAPPPTPQAPASPPPLVPATPSVPPAATVRCRLCASTSVVPTIGASSPHPLDGRMCEGCVDRMNKLRQNVPGYHLLRQIGRGSMGIVYLGARDTDGRLVAIKTITPNIDADRPEVLKFLREADILRRLNHPHIVRFLEMNKADDQLWFAMDFVPGTDAYQLLEKEGPFPIPRAVGLVCQLLEALEYAHGHGFVHRDIKPANLLVSKRNGRETVVLADFGLSRVYQSSQLSGLTMTGAMGGTPMFMPPEQITHYRDAKPAADQYATAMTLYNLLTGEFAFDAPDSLREWITLILEEEPVPIRNRRSDIPAELADIVHKGLRKDESDRFPDVKTMRLALRKFSK